VHPIAPYYLCTLLHLPLLPLLRLVLLPYCPGLPCAPCYPCAPLCTLFALLPLYPITCCLCLTLYFTVLLNMPCCLLHFCPICPICAYCALLRPTAPIAPLLHPHPICVISCVPRCLYGNRFGFKKHGTSHPSVRIRFVFCQVLLCGSAMLIVGRILLMARYRLTSWFEIVCCQAIYMQQSDLSVCYRSMYCISFSGHRFHLFPFMYYAHPPSAFFLYFMLHTPRPSLT
jgi:hypothetical protein